MSAREDDLLSTVTRDNLDISITIGPDSAETFSAERLNSDNFPEDGKEYFTTELEVHLSIGSDSNYATGLIVPDGHEDSPSVGDPLGTEEPDIITIDVDNSLSEERPGTNGEITRIFTGVISNISKVQDGLYEFTAFWPGFNFIQNGSIEFQQPGVDTYEATHANAKFAVGDVSGQLRYSGDVASTIVQRMRKQSRFPAGHSIVEGGYDVNGVKYSKDERVKFENNKTALTQEAPNEGVLTSLVNSTNSIWVIDRYGRFWIGPPTPIQDEPQIPTSSSAHKLRYITETSAGKQSPAWQSIIVIGDGVASRDGWESNAQINSNPAKFKSDVVPKTLVDEEGLAEPVFKYVNLEINTAAEAGNVLEKLRENIKEQQASGEITVVGHPELWPGGSIEMPNSINQPFNNERFTIRKIKHRINNSDGFVTKIEVGGQTNSSEGVFTGQGTNYVFPGANLAEDVQGNQIN